MEQSPRLSLSYLAPSQAQKHVTVNETFRRLDALAQAVVRSRSETEEPADPAEGDAYIIPAGASGDQWSGYDEHDLAAFQDGAWARIAPFEGLRAWVADADEFVVYDGAAWGVLTGGGGETAAKFGVNGAADTTNRLSVKSDAVLFSHDDVTPGSGDAQVKVNKAAAGDTASHLFQTNFSGRAEFGLTGDDDFHIKVSPDNFSTVYEAVVIDKDNGRIGVNGAPSGEGARLKITGIAGSNPADGDFHIAKEDGYALLFLTEYSGAGATNAPFSTQRRARGTIASPAAVQSGDWLGGFSFRGYSGSVFHQRVLVNGIVDGAVSGTTVPSALVFQTGVTSIAERMRIGSDGSVVVGSPTGGGKGPGTINAEAVYDDNAILSCYVFDQALDAAIDPGKWDAKVPDRTVPDRKTLNDKGEEITAPGRTIPRVHEPMRKFAARIGGEHDPLTLDGYAKHWKEKRHLTAMPNEAAFDAEQGMAAGEWIQRLVETAEIQAVLIEKLNERIKAVEARGARL